MSLSDYNRSLTLDQLRHEEEGQYLERKGRSTTPAKLTRELIGFLNASGGVLVFGISDDGEIEDLRELPSLGSFRSLVHDSILPPANIELEELSLEDDSLIFLYHVDPDHERLFQHKQNENVFLRIGDQNKGPLNRAEVNKLEYNKGMRSFEIEPARDFDPDDLDADTCYAYRKAMKYDGPFEELAVKRHLARRKEGEVIYTHAAVLLFAQDPEKYISNASVRYIRVNGTSLQSGKEFNVVKDQRFEGNIPSLIKELETFISTSLRDYYFLDLEVGRFRKVPEFPKEAWLEGIVNALCHRSYNVQGNPIMIRHFDDRLEIANSGPLPAQVTVENISRERFARNPRIARVLYELGYVRELNEGVPRIYRAMKEFALATPEYRDTEGTVSLTLRNKVSHRKDTILSEVMDRIERTFQTMNKTQKLIIFRLLSDQETTVDQLVEAAEVGKKAIQVNLKQLVELGIVERISDKIRDPNAIYRIQSS